MGESDVKKEFRAKADSVKEEKVNEIDRVMAEDRDAQMNAREITHDVQEAESVVVEDMKDEIDDAAGRVKDEIPEKVKKIRNEVVEEVTGQRLDDIEQKKRAKREKKKELVQKFQKMQAKGIEKVRSELKDATITLRSNASSNDNNGMQKRMSGLPREVPEE